MTVNQTANLKRMRELLFLMKEALGNKTEQQKDGMDNLIIPPEEVEKFKPKLMEVINQNQLSVLDLKKIISMTYALNKSTNYAQYVVEFQKLCHHKYNVSSDWIKAAGQYVSLEKEAKKNVIEDLKYFSAGLRDSDPSDYIAVLLWIVREDGLYLPELWNEYKVGIGVYNGLWQVPEETVPLTAEILRQWNKNRRKAH